MSLSYFGSLQSINNQKSGSLVLLSVRQLHEVLVNQKKVRCHGDRTFGRQEIQVGNDSPVVGPPALERDIDTAEIVTNCRAVGTLNS